MKQQQSDRDGEAEGEKSFVSHLFWMILECVVCRSRAPLLYFTVLHLILPENRF